MAPRREGIVLGEVTRPLEPSADERTRGSPDDASIARALREFETQGYVTFENLLPPDFVAELREAYNAALAAKIARFALAPGPRVERAADKYMYDEGRPIPAGGNHDINRWNMHLPSRRPFLDPRVFANPFVMPVVRALVGAQCVCTTLASDTPFPGATFQDVHQDSSRLSLWLNVPLIDVTEADGPLEIWPGSHRLDPLGPAPSFTRAPNAIPHESIPQIAAAIPSHRFTARAGTFVLRDARTLHRGTRLDADHARPMLTLRYEHDEAGVYLPVADALGRVARRLRTAARRDGQIRDARLLNAGNHLGRLVEGCARSDRDGSRAIPRALWSELPEAARWLLRFASLEGHRPAETRAARRLGPTLELVGAFGASFGVDVVIGTARRRATAALSRR